MSGLPRTPHLDSVRPAAVLPGGEVEVCGSGLQGSAGGQIVPHVTIGDQPTFLALSRPERVLVRVPEGTLSGKLVLTLPDRGRAGGSSNPLDLKVAVPMAENLHPVANPAVDADGIVYTTISGSRGQEVPVSVFSITPGFEVRPFVREVKNATGLAFGPDGSLYVSSRAEGTVYRVSPAGAVSTYAEGLGIATGIAFDREGNLFVGDRSGTIFKVGPDRGSSSATAADREIFVYATLEPSVAAYHLAFDDEGVLLVTGPTTSSNQAVHAIDRDGRTSIYFRGLGRAQGMALDRKGNLYVAASRMGQRGIVRITPQREATLVVSGNNLVGLAFLEDGGAALAAKNAVYHIEIGIQGRRLV